MKCAICKGDVPPREENPSHPFCSDRCRLLDLSRWFGGEYRVPGPPVPPQPGHFEPFGGDDDGEGW